MNRESYPYWKKHSHNRVAEHDPPREMEGVEAFVSTEWMHPGIEGKAREQELN